MKTKLGIMMVACTLLCATTAMAQQPAGTPAAKNAADSTAANDVVTASDGLRFDGPVLYDGQRHDGSATVGDPYDGRRQEANGGFDRRFARRRDVSRLFLEYKVVAGDYLGYGAQGAYVPEHWGGYASYLTTRRVPSNGYRYDWFTMGAVYRPMLHPEVMDFQLYGGVAIGDGCGVEYGFRLAAASGNPFSWFSFTMGGISTPGYSAFTLGISVGLSGFFCLSLW